jgi:hypothetical protein
VGKFMFKTRTKTVIVKGEKKKTDWFLANRKFDAFNSTVLGLGDISLPSDQVHAVAAVFDLAGFTNFCNKPDSHLSIPAYLSDFLSWLFEEIKERSTIGKYEGGRELYSDLPFLAKFLGDGVLFLWDTENMNGTAICNIVGICNDICWSYRTNFYPKIKKAVVEPPIALRCGMARGIVCSVGNAEDYVGPCINIAARLQKLSDLTFCCHRRGFEAEKYMLRSALRLLVLKLVSIRDVGQSELVYVLREEFDNLPEEQKELFSEP